MERVTEGAQYEDWDGEPPGLGPADARNSVGGAESGDEPSGSGRARRSAEPLRASWRPAESAAQRRPTGAKRTGLRRFTAAFGWRVYLVPILLVITGLVVFDTTQRPEESDSASAPAGSAHSGGDGPDPLVTEVPAEPVDLDIPTAELPEGGDYTKSGEGTWHVVPLAEGDGKQAGDSPNVFTYTVEVEDGLDPGSYAGDDGFGAAVEGTLSDKRSWTGTGDVSLKRVDAGHPAPDLRVTLASPDAAGQWCGTAIEYESSCYRSAGIDGQGPRVVLNLARWVRGAKAFSADLSGYRQYLINHEVGHFLNNNHTGCQRDGALAPVMMQQTFGVDNDYVAELNDLPGGDVGAVPADGKVCKPNAWPNPQPGDS